MCRINAVHCRTSISARMDCFSWDLEVGILTFEMSTRKAIPPGLNWWKAVHIEMPETPKGLAISIFFAGEQLRPVLEAALWWVQWVRVVSWEDQNVFRVQKCAESYTYYFSPPKMQVHKSAQVETSKERGSWTPELPGISVLFPTLHGSMAASRAHDQGCWC